MRNILAIAQKEIRGYFTSPIAYIVVGFFALLYGFFFYGTLDYFIRSSMGMGQFGMQGPQNMNINQQMIRPLFLNLSVVLLFMLPFLTARTYAEERRSGTIELLLTSPLTDLQIVLGKFLGCLVLLLAMLAITGLHIGVLFLYGTPDWRPVVSGYLGILLFGASIVALGLFISSLTRNQIVAGVATFATVLVFWVIDWIGQSLPQTAQSVLQYLSMTEHLDDFVKGVIDTRHLVYYVSFIAFGLFLTMRSVDAERWRG